MLLTVGPPTEPAPSVEIIFASPFPPPIADLCCINQISMGSVPPANVSLLACWPYAPQAPDWCTRRPASASSALERFQPVRRRTNSAGGAPPKPTSQAATLHMPRFIGNACTGSQIPIRQRSTFPVVLRSSGAQRYHLYVNGLTLTSPGTTHTTVYSLINFPRFHGKVCSEKKLSSPAIPIALAIYH